MGTCKKCGNTASSINFNQTGCSQCTSGAFVQKCTIPVSTQCGPCTPAYNYCKPVYSQAGLCPQDNKQTVYVHKISQVFSNANAFTMPACGAQVSVVFEGISDIVTGAWLWAYNIGFLEIVGFNANTQEITLSNPCPENCPGLTQQPPGTPIPRCTPFALTVPPCLSAGGGAAPAFPYLAIDFTAPASGNCTLITVTNVNGVSVNKNVSINTGVYRVNSIPTGTTMEICNDGAGLPSGTPVIAQDASGNYIVPIVLIDSNPCNADPVLEAVPLGCADGVTTPIEGSESGQVLVWDAGTEKASFRSLGLPVLDCTELTVCLTLDPDLPFGTSYLVTVVDTSAFSPAQIVTIGGTSFVVDSVDSATTMHITPVEAVVVVQTYPPGSVLCSADCCTQLSAYILDNTAECGGAWLWSSANRADAEAIAAPVLLTATNNAVGNIATLEIVNESCVYTMGYIVSINWLWEFQLEGLDDEVAAVTPYGEYIDTTNPLDAPVAEFSLEQTYTFRTVPGGAAGINMQTFSHTFGHYDAILPVAPSSSRYIRARANIDYPAGDLTTGLRVTGLGCRITALGVALR